MSPQCPLIDRLHAYALHEEAMMLLHVMVVRLVCREKVGRLFRLPLPATVVCYVSVTWRR